MDEPSSGGKRSAIWEDEPPRGNAPGTTRDEDDDELAACATRSQTCREDCLEERAVAFLALITRPLATPAYAVPTDVGTSSVKCWRCYPLPRQTSKNRSMVISHLDFEAIPRG